MIRIYTFINTFITWLSITNDVRLEINYGTSGFQNIGVYEFKRGACVSEPYVLLFKKKNRDSVAPTHQLCVYYLNKIYCLILPLNKEDKERGLYDGEAREVPVPPPLYFTPQERDEPCHFDIIDMSKSELVKGESQTVSFQIDMAEEGPSGFVDKETGLFVKATMDKDSMKGLVLMLDDVTLTHNQAVELSKAISELS